MKKSVRAIEIFIPNKLFYTLITLGILAVLTFSVYAYNTPGPASSLGHSADELTGVCRTDGVGCTFPDSQADLGLYVNPSDQLCYPTTSSSSCTIQTATCLASETFMFPTDDCGSASFTCQQFCQTAIACDGDATSWSCGSTSVVYYDQSQASCEDQMTTCTCFMGGSGQTYQREIPQNARCI